MDIYLYLIFHVLSHALLGASIAWCLLPRHSWKERFTTLSLGTLCGISPDLFGWRETSPWTHSIFVTPFLVLGIAIIAKQVNKSLSFKMLWGVSVLAVWIGHLLLDLMGHEVSLFYPFSQFSPRLGVLTLGDPFIWFPLSVGILLSLCLQNNPKLPVFLALLFIMVFLLFRIMAKEVIYYKVELEYPMTEKSYITIEPNTYYEYPLFSWNWLEYRFQVNSSHYLRGGYAGILGEKLGKVTWYYFFPAGRDFKLIKGKYVEQPSQLPNKLVLSVLQEWTENGVHYIKGQANKKIYTFKEVEKDRWQEI
ncbi:metal-dependent hydrolase [Paenibacillus glycanilyticus]|uniref:metal-dependent hydrolase n=1 Tax=Paenibacillus glycanilyticus TaxID=126569 RepID=UPI00190FF458|nr:metal-dependent hydrolase [Paenibacillus glycanilyticus]